jgi:hypothetical protein
MQAQGPIRDFFLEHDTKKWMPVLGKDHAQTNNLERDDDSKRNHLALGEGGRYQGC